MTRATIASGAFAAMFVLLIFADDHRARGQDAAAAPASPAGTPAMADAAGLLYGRVATYDGAIYEGRLRFGGGEEAFWDHYFNGVKDGNPWAAHVPPERLPRVRDSIGLFGIEIAAWERTDLRRPFMRRFGDIARIEAQGRDLRVMLKSGTVVELDRFEADDFADGVRVWDVERGVVDLDEWGIRTIELLPTPRLSAAPGRLHGTVRTRNGDFTGFVQWDREESVGADELDGRTADRALSLRFDTIRSIARRSRDSSLVTLLDGREMVLSGTRKVGDGNRGIYVDDQRYGRVLVSWDAFDRVDFSPGGASPAYGDFPPGRPLTGSVMMRSGILLTGRLVYDLDESETTETLDAPSEGVDYTIPFGLIASIVPRSEQGGARLARVTLHSGEELQLEPEGDLGAGNAGLLIFVDGRERAAHVPWSDVDRVDFDRPPDASSGPR
jgi:hypothetical protein